MRLRTLLLGSAAAVFAVGTATAPAQAADPVAGMAVAAPTMAAYLASCAGGNGIQFADWCFHPYGEIGFDHWVGTDIKYGTKENKVPGANAKEMAGIFPLASNVELCLVATRETDTGAEIEVRFPSFFDSCGSDWEARLRVTGPGGFRLTIDDDSIEGRFGTITALMEENTDEMAFVNPALGPLPTTELTVELGTGNFDVELWGQLGFYTWGLGGVVAPAASVELGFDPGNFGVTLFGKIGLETFDAGVTNELGIEADATVEATFGPAEIEVGAHVDHVELALTGVLAWGLHAAASASFGMTTVSGSVLFGVNDDFGDPGDLRGQPYDLTAGDRVLLASVGAEFDWNDIHSTEALLTYTTVLDLAGYQTLQVGLEHTFKPHGDALELTAEAWWKTDFGAPGVGNVFGAGLGITVPIND